MVPCYLYNEGKSKNHMNDFFVVSDPEISENIKLRRSKYSEFYIRGYAHAFSDPPYPISIDGKSLNELFLRLNNLLFGGLNAPLEIYEWAGDWCNYFDDGYDWWGAYLWTVHNLNTMQMVAIGPSSTD